MPASATTRIDDRIAKRQLHRDTRQRLRFRDSDTKDGPPGLLGGEGINPFLILPPQRANPHATADPNLPKQTASSSSSTSISSTSSTSVSSTSSSSAQQLLTSISTSRALTISTPSAPLTTTFAYQTTLPSPVSTTIQVAISIATPETTSPPVIKPHDSSHIPQGAVVALASIGIIGDIMTLASLVFFCFRRRQKNTKHAIQGSHPPYNAPPRSIAPSKVTHEEALRFVPPITMPENQARGKWFTKLKRYSTISSFMTPSNPLSRNHIMKDIVISRRSEKHDIKIENLGNELEDEQEGEIGRRMALRRGDVAVESSDTSQRGSQYWTRMAPRAF